MLCHATKGPAGPGIVHLKAAWGKEVARLVEGDCYAHWFIDRSDWHRYLDERKTRTNIALFIVPPACMVPLIGVSAAMYDSGDWIFGSVFWTFVIPPLAALAIGGAACGYIYCTTFQRRERLRDMQGQCYLGHRGLYITGMYWPYFSYGFGLAEAKASFSKGPVGDLVLTFRNRTKHGTVDNELRIPVPKENRVKVEEFVKMSQGES
ncbi:MAG: hypothetical protein MI757_12395 [Pirellulales bacterium]|nr:hypothetical protein [Pirellulales bacterium]